MLSLLSADLFRNTIRVANILDQDRDRQNVDRDFVSPDLGPNCLQGLSADNGVIPILSSLASKEIILLFQVVLPTFILERRSLLELFADCMAHPDVFLR